MMEDVNIFIFQNITGYIISTKNRTTNKINAEFLGKSEAIIKAN